MFYGFESQIKRGIVPAPKVVMQSIFVQIPSYQDHELPKTILDCIANSSGEVNVNFGVHVCWLNHNDIYIPKEYPDWVKLNYQTSIAPSNIGVLMSRYIANEFYNGEDYYLQIDSHMKFKKNWDLELINLYNKYNNLGFNKPLITMYPSGYYYDNGFDIVKGKTDGVTTVGFTENLENFKNTYVPHQTACTTSPGCLYTASVSGGFIFTSGDFSKIKPNKKIAFWGEEILTAARAFTSGFDLLTSDKSYAWHLYYDHSKSKQLNGRSLVWVDFSGKWEELKNESQLELNRIFDNKIIGEGALGNVRTLEEYGVFAGLDFKNKQVTQCKWG